MSTGEASKGRPARVDPFDSEEALSAKKAEATEPARHELVGFECSLATTSLERLESAERRLTPDRLASLFDRNRAIDELAVLRTCHRLEVLCWTPVPAMISAVVAPEIGPAPDLRVRREAETVTHLFRVTAGLESTAVGEREVRDQVRMAAARVRSRSPRPVLRPLLLEAVSAAEEAAPRVPKNRSIAALAAARVLEESAQPFPRVLILGSGLVGRAVAEHLAPYGRVTLVYRTRPPDAAFLRATDARAVPWGSLSQELPLADAVITAVKTAGRILGTTDLALRSRPLVVVDLGLPRNVDPGLAVVGGLRLIDLEGLRARAPPAPITEVEELVLAQARRAAETVAAAGFEAWVDDFRRGAEIIRRELLTGASAALADLTAEQKAAVERLTQRLTSRLLSRPTAGLRAIPSGAEGEERRRWAWELLRPDTPRS